MCTDDDFDVTVDLLRVYLDHLEVAHRMIELRGAAGCARCDALKLELGPGGGPLPVGALP